MVGKAKTKSSRTKSSLSKSSKSSKSKSGATSSRSKPSGDSTAHFDLYCAVYRPRAGNYYHWAFVINDQSIRMPWHIFQVTQDEHDNYHPSYLRVDPTSTDRCLQPLPHLGKMHPAWLEPLAGRIRAIQVPGEAMHWNCQDYVMEIWEIVRECGMVEQHIYEAGQRTMMRYYGQDFGSQAGVEETWDQEDEDDQNVNAGHVLSDEFVYDSDS